MMDRASRATRALDLLDTRAVIMANGGAPRPITFDLIREARRRGYTDLGLLPDEAHCHPLVWTDYRSLFYREDFNGPRELALHPVFIDSTLPAGVMQLRRGDRVLAEIWEPRSDDAVVNSLRSASTGDRPDG